MGDKSTDGTPDSNTAGTDDNTPPCVRPQNSPASTTDMARAAADRAGRITSQAGLKTRLYDRDPASTTDAMSATRLYDRQRPDDDSPLEPESSFAEPIRQRYPQLEHTSAVADTRPSDLSHLRRMQRTLRLVQQCRRALLRATNEDDLLQSVCEIAVAEGGYRFAWVGVAEHDEERHVRPAAQAGYSDGYLDTVDVHWSDVPQGRGPTGTAIRERQPYWARSIDTDSAMAPWREHAIKRGYLSSIAIPMSTDEGVYGALTLYSGVRDAFDAEEVELLTELADDLAFGIDTLRTRLAHRTMAQAVEQSPAVVVITDLEGHIEYVNPRFTDLTGYTFDEVKGKNPRILKSGLTSQDEYARLWKTIRSGGRWSGVFHQRRKDGSTYEERASIQPMLDSNGRAIRFLKVAEDISERSSLEQQLRQAQKMEAVGRLAGGIAHDFNNLLTAILGFTELALHGLPTQDPLRGDLQQVLAAGEHAVQLTRQLLAFSRQKSVKPEYIDVAAAVTAAEPMLRRLLGEDVSLQMTATDTTCVAVAEPGQVEQIVVNLVVNARDAMPSGGTVRVSVTPVAIDDTVASTRVDLVPGPYVRIEVTDTGHGMDDVTMARVFEPFFTTKPVGKGTGLGLATVYGIVRQANGAVDVTSAPGAGATFRIWLPLVNEHPAALNAPPERLESGIHSGAILVVDDDNAVCQFASRVLQRAGYEVVCASSPGEALLIAEQQGDRLDLLLADVVMPHMNGRELARRIGQARPHIKVVYMSGYTDDVLLGNALGESELRLVRKPFKADALVRAISAELQGRA